MIKLKDLLNDWYKQDPGPKRWTNNKGLTEFEKSIELGKVYTDKDMKPFNVSEEQSCDNKLAGESNAQWRARCGPRPLGAISRGSVSESTKEYSKTLDKIAKSIEAKKSISKKDRDTLMKIAKLMKEEKLDEAGSIGGAIDMGGMNDSYTAPKRDTSKGDMQTFLQKYSSKEAKTIIDGELKRWASELRKFEGKVVKDWMSAAKSGQIDFFDIIRGLKTGDVSRAHPYETQFLVSLLTKDKIVDRFRSYFKGKKGKSRG
tara:strand:- start:102 stop:878 length:777 start_codon:yes stop_codon:yes gene_type:complete